MPRESNWEAYEQAQVASGVKMSEELNHPSIYERGIKLEVANTDTNVAGDCIIKIREYLEDPNMHVPYRVKAQS